MSTHQPASPETTGESEAAQLYYRDGLAVVRNVRERPPGTYYDDRTDAWVAPGHRLPELRRWARERGLQVGESPVAGEPVPLYDPRTPRTYQREALERWQAAAGRGTVVLPTGAGKTFVALLAIHETGGGCVVAPTKALLVQWYGQLVDAFGEERVGAWYGEEKELGSITVTTYHSAFALLERHGGRFPLLVLDEAHHLADRADGEPSSFQDALRVAPSPARLGLTATYPDGRDAELRRLLGPVVYRRTVSEMADRVLADFVVERRFVSLSADERADYEDATRTYEGFVSERGYREKYPEGDDWWRVFMAETRRSPRARRAFTAFQARDRIVATCKAKLAEAGRILRWFSAEQAVLFCGSRAAAELVSRRFAIPLVDSDTPASERKSLLDLMAAGEVRALSAVQVLDEGWDVPGAKLGIVLGDSTRGGRRQHVQRLGRLLRRQGEQVASLFEIVAADTHEFLASQKRGAGYRQARRNRDQLGLGL